MLPDGESYVLRTTLTSPFGRKVRMAAGVLGLSDRIRIEPANALDEGDSLRQQNPLGKMPCLLLADGSAIYDSRVIIELLQEAAGVEALLPMRGLPRYRALTRAALTDGMTDAALLMVYEGRFRDAGTHSERWLAHQRGKVLRGLAEFERAPLDAAITDIVSIGLACALGYLDWRQPVAWRDEHPALVAWFDAFSAHEPMVAATQHNEANA
jgi:glutathione S-transferase